MKNHTHTQTHEHEHTKYMDNNYKEDICPSKSKKITCFSEREREREREQKLKDYRQIIKESSSIDEIITCQKLIFGLCKVNQAELIQNYESTNDDFYYLEYQLFLFNLIQSNFSWLAKNVEETINSLKTKPSLFNLYGKLTTENFRIKELEKLLEKIKKTRNQNFEGILIFHLLNISREQAKIEVENLINNIGGLEWKRLETANFINHWKKEIDELEDWREVPKLKKIIFTDIAKIKMSDWEEYEDDSEKLFNFFNNLPLDIREKIFQDQDYRNLIDNSILTDDQWLELFWGKEIRTIQRAIRTYQNNKDYRSLLKQSQNKCQEHINILFSQRQIFQSGWAKANEKVNNLENKLEIENNKTRLLQNRVKTLRQGKKASEELFQQNLEDYEQKLTTAESQIKQQNQDLINSSQLIEDSNNRLNNTLKNLGELNEQNQELLNRPTVEDLAKMRAEKNASNQELTKIQEKLTQTTNRLNNLQSQLTKLQNENQQLKSSRNSCLTPEEQDDLTQQISEKDAEITLIQNLLVDLHQQDKQLLTDFQQEKTTHDLTKNQLTTEQTVRQTAEDQKSQTQQELQTKTAEKEQLINTQNILNQQINDLQEQLISEQEAKIYAENSLVGFQQSLADLQTENRVFLNDKENLIRENQQLAEKLFTNQNQQNEKETIYQEEKRLWELTVTGLNSQLDKALANYTQAIERNQRLQNEKDNRPAITLVEHANLCQENAREKRKVNWLQNKAKSLREKLATEQNISQNLQDQIDNHTCPVLAPHTCSPCTLTHLPEPHVCPIINKVDCSHDDNENRQQLIKQEQQIIQQINQSLNLGLNNPSLEQVITNIQQLISKPPKEIYQEFNNNELEQELNQANQTIINLEKELANQDTPFGENLKTIKEIDLKDLEKELNIQLSAKSVKQIQQATNYQQLATARNAEIKKHLQQNLNSLAVVNPPKEIIQPNKERIILIGLLFTALLTIGGLLVKLREKKKAC